MKQSALALALLFTLITTPALAQVEFPADIVLDGPCLNQTVHHTDPAPWVFLNFNQPDCTVDLYTQFPETFDQYVVSVRFPWKSAPLPTIQSVNGLNGAGWIPGSLPDELIVFSGTGTNVTDPNFPFVTIILQHSPFGSGPFLADNPADVSIQLIDLQDPSQPINKAMSLQGQLFPPTEFHAAEMGVNAQASANVAAATEALACPPATIACEDIFGNPFCSPDGVGCAAGDLDLNGDGCVDGFDLTEFKLRLDNSVSFGVCDAGLGTYMPEKQIP